MHLNSSLPTVGFTNYNNQVIKLSDIGLLCSVSLIRTKSEIEHYFISYRIHYPLPLVYQGKPDPVHLQGMVRQLRDEIRKLKSSTNSALQDEDYEQLKEEYVTSYLCRKYNND